MATLKVDDGQASESEAQWPVEKISFVVRSTMPNGSRHLLEFATLDRCFLMKKVELAANSAHVCSLLLQEL